MVALHHACKICMFEYSEGKPFKTCMHANVSKISTAWRKVLAKHNISISLQFLTNIFNVNIESPNYDASLTHVHYVYQLAL